MTKYISIKYVGRFPFSDISRHTYRFIFLGMP